MLIGAGKGSFRMASTLRLSMILVLALGLGCKKDKGAGAAGSASAKPASSALANAEPGLLGELVSLTQTCKVTVEASTLSCPKGENRKLVNQFVSNQRKRAEAVGTLAAALGHEKPEVRVAAANVLYQGFRSTWTETKPGDVKPADAEALIAAAFKLPKAQARQVIPAAVHAAALAGRTEAFDAALAKATEPEFKTVAYRHLMTHGRLKAFDRVKEAAKSAAPSDVLAALESPRNMQAWTPEEQEAICPWAAEFLSDKRPSVASRAASLLGNCGGAFVDQLITKGEEALKNKTFTNAEVAAYRELCSPRKRNQPNGPTEEQCARSRKLLEKVVETNGLDVQARTSALSTLAYQWPDDATKKLAKKLEKNPEKQLAEQATRTLQRLEQRSAMANPSARGRLPLPPVSPGVTSGAGHSSMPLRKLPTPPAQAQANKPAE